MKSMIYIGTRELEKFMTYPPKNSEVTVYQSEVSSGYYRVVGYEKNEDGAGQNFAKDQFVKALPNRKALAEELLDNPELPEFVPQEIEEELLTNK